MAAPTYFQRGFGLKAEVQDQLVKDYHSTLVDRLKTGGHRVVAGDLAIRLADEFGFCYGVDRAIDYAYEARRKFPDRRIFLVGEIIHNPGVNDRLLEMGVGFLTGPLAAEAAMDGVVAEDVVILPAFGVPTGLMDRFRAIGCVLVDTTCGSVLNVWKRVERYARGGFTSVIHGKHHHEETRATASRALANGGQYLVVRDFAETETVCAQILGHADGAAFRAAFNEACSPDFDPDVHLDRIGVANQTTMLSSESLEIAVRLRDALARARGEAYAAEHFLSFDTICSATQDRQDAVGRLLDEGVDVMVVIGGYNSSNTCNLSRMCSRRVPTYHVATSECVRPDGTIRFLPAGDHDEAESPKWLPSGAVTVGVTAGASTPDSEVAAVIGRILGLRGHDFDTALRTE